MENEVELKGKNKAFVYEGTYVYESQREWVYAFGRRSLEGERVDLRIHQAGARLELAEVV